MVKLNKVNETYYSEDEYDEDDEERDFDKEFEENVKKTVNEIKLSLIDYVEHNSYPLCEYLEDIHIEQYVRWNLSQ